MLEAGRNEMAVEIAIGAIVAAAVNLMAQGAAKKTGEETVSAGLKLLRWMRDKLTGRAKEALEDMEKDPSSEDNRADLRKQLIKQLEGQPQLLEELRSLVPASEQAAAQQVINQTGDNNRAAQVAGQNNQVRVS
jgi:hypothetical protein